MSPAHQELSPLLVATDPTAVRRSFRPVLILTCVTAVIAVLAAVLAGAATATLSGVGAGMLAASPFLVCAVFLFLLAVQLSGRMEGRAATGVVLRVDEQGMTWWTVRGTAVLPWHAIASVERRGRQGRDILVFRLAEGVTPSTAGVISTFTPADFRRGSKVGLHIGAVGITVSTQTILDAVARFSGGRLTAR